MNPVDRTTAIPALPNLAGQANVPGLRRLYLIEVRHVLGLTDPRTLAGQAGAASLNTGWLLPPGGLQLAEDAQVVSFVFPADRGDHEQKAAVSVHGVVYQQALQLIVPNDHPLTALAVARLSRRHWLAVYDNTNGQRRVVGTPQQPLRFFSGFKTAPNGYAFNWSGDTRPPALFLNDPDLFAVNADFSSGFSYDFFS